MINTWYPYRVVPIHLTSAVTTISSADIILARNVDLMAAPPSGQLVRLRQGKSPSEGYVQMFSNNEWGWVGVTSRLVYCNMSSAL